MSADGAADGGGWGRMGQVSNGHEMDILDIATGLFLFRICGFLMPAKMRKKRVQRQALSKITCLHVIDHGFLSEHFKGCQAMNVRKPFPL